MQQARTMISVTKVKLVNFADNAVKTFKRHFQKKCAHLSRKNRCGRKEKNKWEKGL